MYLKDKVRGRKLENFLQDFDERDFVKNDYQVGRRLRTLIGDNLPSDQVDGPWTQCCVN